MLRWLRHAELLDELELPDDVSHVRLLKVLQSLGLFLRGLVRESSLGEALDARCQQLFLLNDRANSF